MAPSVMMEAYAETTVVTVCVGYGKDEVPRLQWKYEDNVLTNNTPSVVIHESLVMENDLVFVQSILTLCDIGLNDSGNYSCTADNSFGNAESTITLNVKLNGKSCCSLYIHVSCLHEVYIKDKSDSVNLSSYVYIL
jgi:hypothetical protein